jgi:flagellar motor switch protein FliN
MSDSMHGLGSGLSDAVTQWAARFSEALEPLAGESVSVELEAPHQQEPGAEFLCCRHEFGGSVETSLWVAAKDDVWRGLGDKILRAAGLDDASEEDVQSTYLELLSQAAGGFANTLTAQAGREVECSESSRSEMPAGPVWIPIRVQFANQESQSVLVFCAPGLAELWTSETEQTAEAHAPDQPDQYGTFGLLLDVELPVSVSFGKATLPIRDVIKLTTGSVVELDRAVTEPVDLVINNRVIARGEVVVVDGNYGVRIAQIMTRDERIRSLR